MTTVPLLEDVEHGVGAVLGAAAGFLEDIPESDFKRDARERREARRPRLPVLLVPGFMSTGLTIERSEVTKAWEGKRIWLNLQSLGLQKFYNNKATRGEKSKRDSERHSFADFAKSATGGGVTIKEESGSESDSEEESEENDGDVESNPGGVRPQEVLSRNLWIKHISLSPTDLKTDPPGIQVRPMEGLGGIDYLTPGTLTNFVSYVFAPVIKVLQKHGYEDGVNLDAAPYDWRLSPKHLEERDQYFTRTMKKVEGLYERTGMPVVLVCHSLGCRVTQYFLDFAHEKDKTWCERHIHTYMPVGGPHLGAPFTLRAIVSGNQMGLEAFLNESEALAMGRTLGSIPWLIPSHIPPHCPENAFVRREGAFEICINAVANVSPLFEGRLEGEDPKKLRLVLRYGKHVLRSRFFPVVNDEVHFEGKFIFSTGPEGPYSKQCCSCCCQCCILRCSCCACCSDNQLIVSIGEPGVKGARRTRKRDEMKRKCCSIDTSRKCIKIIFCWWLIKFVFIVVGYVVYLASFKLWLMLADAISRLSGASTQLAVAAPIDLGEFVHHESEGRDVEVEFRNDLKRSSCCRKKADVVMPSINVNIRWVPPGVPQNTSSGCQLSELGDDRHCRIDGLACNEHKQKWTYDPVAGSGMIKQELGHDASIFQVVPETYDKDPLRPRGSLGLPPVKNVKAVYGINLPTEVGAIYRRKKALVERKHKVKSKYEVDDKAVDDKAEFQRRNGYVFDDGVLFETKDTPQKIIGAESKSVSCSGDGTVPYWSLQHVRNWKQQCDVDVTELDGALHREILADERFHEVLIDYVTTKVDVSDANSSV